MIDHVCKPKASMKGKPENIKRNKTSHQNLAIVLNSKMIRVKGSLLCVPPRDRHHYEDNKCSSHDEDNGSDSNHEYKILTLIEDQIESESDNCDSIDIMNALKEIDMLKNVNKNKEKEIILHKKKGFAKEITQLKVFLEEAKRIEEVLTKQVKQNERHNEKLIRI